MENNLNSPFSTPVTFNNLTIVVSQYKNVIGFYGSTKLKVTGAFVIQGSSPTVRPYFKQNTVNATNKMTIEVGSFSGIDYCDFEYCTKSGAALTGTALGNCGANTNITFPAAVTHTKLNGAGKWTNTALWNTGVVPLVHDTVIFNASSFTSGGQVFDLDVCCLPALDFSACVNSPTIRKDTFITYSYFYGSVNFTGIGAFTSTYSANNLHFCGFSDMTYNQNGLTFSGSMSLVFRPYNKKATITGNIGGIWSLQINHCQFYAGSYNLNINYSLYFNTASPVLEIHFETANIYMLSQSQAFFSDFKMYWERSTLWLTTNGTGVSATWDFQYATPYGGVYRMVLRGSHNGGFQLNTGYIRTFEVDRSVQSKTIVIWGSQALKIVNFICPVSSTRTLTIKAPSTSKVPFIKGNGGTVNLDYIVAQYLTGRPTLTWYVGNNSTISNSDFIYTGTAPAIRDTDNGSFFLAN